MKKLFVILAVALLSLGASAQVRFGAKVGFDMTHFWGKDIKHGMQPNYQVGALMEYKFNDRFGIAPEVVFAAQGGKFKVAGVTDKYNMNYINVPVMLKFYASNNFSIDFGPQLGINVYAKEKLSGGGVDINNDIKDDTKTIDFGVGLGATYNITENAFVQARYTLGVTKVFKNVAGLGTPDVKNGNIQVAFGWMF